MEKEYREREKLVQLDKNQGLEERLIAMQKKYEVQKKKELEEEVFTHQNSICQFYPRIGANPALSSRVLANIYICV